ncbi:MAG: HmuY family protein [Bacteroidetes bacterium]|nr:HmuY family protein [Bacteroidota bacterium]
MKTTSYLFVLVSFVSILSLSSCSNNDPSPVTLTSVTFKNLAADPPSGGYNPTNGQPIGVTKKYTFFSFKTGAVVANTDSATNKWDVGFNGTTIIVNGGQQRVGKGGAIVSTGIFDNLLTAPTDGYDMDSVINSKPVNAITTGSGKGWYNYNGTTNTITPIAGRFLIIRTGDERYAKMEIISYYKDAPETVSSAIADRYYTFRYVYQGDGTKNFK